MRHFTVVCRPYKPLWQFSLSATTLTQDRCSHNSRNNFQIVELASVPRRPCFQFEGHKQEKPSVTRPLTFSLCALFLTPPRDSQSNPPTVLKPSLNVFNEIVITVDTSGSELAVPCKSYTLERFGITQYITQYIAWLQRYCQMRCVITVQKLPSPSAHRPWLSLMCSSNLYQSPPSKWGPRAPNIEYASRYSSQLWATSTPSLPASTAHK